MNQGTKVKGISLIVLVITIIIMIILAGAIILSLSKDNVISKAKEGKESSDFVSIREAVELAKTNSMFEGGVSSYDGIVPANYSQEISVTTDGTILIKGVASPKITNIPNAVEKLGAVYIPVGFIYIEGTKETGLVIEDQTAGIAGNQYVWIPVEGTLERKAFRGENLTSTYTEDVGTAYNTMAAQVEEYNGFYVSRYEAGIAGNVQATTSSPVQTGMVKPLSQKNTIVWNNIAWSVSGNLDTNNGAALVAKSAYVTNSAVQSSLLYGAQYDAMLNFINSASTSVINSKTWGNHSDSAFTVSSVAKKSTDNGVTYTDASGATKTAWNGTTGDKWLLTTGASEQSKAKNIYDVAGNAWEWTYELAPSNGGRVLRSGYFGGSDADYPAAYRYHVSPDYSITYCGFRFALYIK